MSQSADFLQQEYERFIEFGQLLDRQTRKYLVQYLRGLIEPGAEAPPELDDRYYQYFRRALDDLFSIEELLPLMRENERISRQIVADTLRWLRKSFDKTRRHPYQEESERLAGWAITPLAVFLRRWPALIQFLGSEYRREELDVRFYQDRFGRLAADGQLESLSPEDRRQLEWLLTDLLAQWDARLSARILEYQLAKLDEERQEYLALVEAKVREFSRLKTLVSPFTDYLGWDLSRELWQESSLDLVQQYHELLRDEEAVRELADLLGRLREAEIEMEEETLERTIVRQEWIPEEWGRAEIVGVKESDDLSNLLSSEAGLLGDPDTELLFLQRFADKSLQTFRFEDRRLVRSEDQLTEVHQRVRQREKGPFIVCVDTSESMRERPEQIAKVLCLAILKMAIRENRRAYLINFSIGIKSLDLFDIGNSLDELARFLRMSFHGGTDVTPALYEALRQLNTNDYRDADVLVISDFIMPRLQGDVLRQVRSSQQNRNTCFHSLTLSSDPNAQVLEAFDTNWVYDPKEKGVIRELRSGLETIQRH